MQRPLAHGAEERAKRGSALVVLALVEVPAPRARRRRRVRRRGGLGDSGSDSELGGSEARRLGGLGE